MVINGSGSWWRRWGEAKRSGAVTELNGTTYIRPSHLNYLMCICDVVWKPNHKLRFLASTLPSSFLFHSLQNQRQSLHKLPLLLQAQGPFPKSLHTCFTFERVTHLLRLVNKHYLQSTRHGPKKKIQVIRREVDYHSVRRTEEWGRVMGFFPLFSSLDSSKVGLGPTTPHFFWSWTACRLQTWGWDNTWNGENARDFFWVSSIWSLVGTECGLWSDWWLGLCNSCLHFLGYYWFFIKIIFG